MTKPYSLLPGTPYPLGYKITPDGVNFSISSRHATDVELWLYESSTSVTPIQVIRLERSVNHTFFSWHVFVKNLTAGVWYGWKIDGPSNTRETGLRFDPKKLLLDPWAKAVDDQLWNREKATVSGDNSNHAMRSMVVDTEGYNWEGDLPLAIRSEKAIIYELHVGGFTKSPTSNVRHPGTFAGLIEKIPYLQELGITHVELLPVMAFDRQDVPTHTAELGLHNYWGYSTHSFFSPHPGYCVSPASGSHLQEFRDLVKALHKAGIGVILDVVFNHTSESGEDGPVINFKGIMGNTFYLTDKNDKRVFHDYTGCGNTINGNHPLVTNFIISCLEYWVREMHVDGFRFDLASALSRGEDGTVLQDPPLVWGIELSEKLNKTKLIAEAWDAAGLYQVGNFPGYRWGEWNGRYRDIIRRFISGEEGINSEAATRICGSSDFYQPQHRLPISGINFVTCHDGFTLIDLFSFNKKHNHANGENNRDGCNNNLSFNCGIEGTTNNNKTLTKRKQHAKNAFSILLVSLGVPMLLAGDEFLNTQNGNNNSYCQDNSLSWLDWNMLEAHQDMVRFVRMMISLRKRHPSLMRRHFLTGQPLPDSDRPDIEWFGMNNSGAPDWTEKQPFIRYTLSGMSNDEPDLHIVFNMTTESIKFALPANPGRYWALAVNTGEKSPNDIMSYEEQMPCEYSQFTSSRHSVIIFESHSDV